MTLTCKVCAWLCADADPVRASFWARCDAWESAHSNEYELWFEAADQDRERVASAQAVQDERPEAAFRIYSDLAEAGMAWAMETVASHHEFGIVVAADFEKAQTYYRRAIKAGSWMATLKYARLLARHGHFETCETLLQDGVNADFVPAYFWLARYRLKQSSSRTTCREIRPLLEYAVEAGHPAAEMLLARLKLFGKFGLRQIPLGFREISAIVVRNRSEASSSVSNKIDERPGGDQALGSAGWGSSLGI